VSAEFGDFDPQLHGNEYLAEYYLLPKVITAYLESYNTHYMVVRLTDTICTTDLANIISESLHR